MATQPGVMKVTPEVARVVRDLHKAGVSNAMICERMDLSHSTVWHIIWRWERRLEMQAELRSLRAEAQRLEARCMVLERRLAESEHE